MIFEKVAYLSRKWLLFLVAVLSITIVCQNWMHQKHYLLNDSQHVYNSGVMSLSISQLRCHFLNSSLALHSSLIFVYDSLWAPSMVADDWRRRNQAGGPWLHESAGERVEGSNQSMTFFHIICWMICQGPCSLRALFWQQFQERLLQQHCNLMSWQYKHFLQ